MKCVVVGNIPLRTEVLKKGKHSGLAMSGSYAAAVTAKKLGWDSTLITRLSNSFPKKFLEQIKKEKINLITLPAWQDTVYDVKYTAGYEDKTKRIVRIKSEAGPIMTVPKVDADVVMVSSYYGNVGLDVLKTLKKPDNILCLDVQAFIKQKKEDGKVYYQPWSDFQNYAHYVDVLKISSDELYYLTGRASLNTASSLLKYGIKVVFLTTVDNVYVFWGKKYLKVPIYYTKKKSVAGIGEVYDTALTIRMKEKEGSKPESQYDLLDACYFAEAAASLAKEKPYYKDSFKRKEIEKRCETLKKIFLA